MPPAHSLLAALGLVLAAGLAPAQPAAAPEVKSLLDKNSLGGWVDVDGKPVAPGLWTIEDGVLTRAKAGAGDLWSAERFADFELTFEWRVTKGGNSGIKYRVVRQGKAALGFEYQVLDDAEHQDGKKPTSSAAALYHVIAPNPAKVLKPVGEWNHARIVAKGRHIEHWLNGTKVVDVTTEGPEWAAAIAKSKYAKNPAYGREPAGPIVIQDHGDPVSFRNLLIRKL